MISSLLFILLVAGKTEVWTESSMVKVFPNSAPDSLAGPTARIYAARGEYESFQVCIRAEKKPIRGVQLRASALDKQIGAPEVRRVAYAKVTTPSLRPAAADQLRWPDPLLDGASFDVPARETRALWVTYDIPPAAKPDIHVGQIELVFSGSIKQVIPVTIEVFDLELPAAPTFDAMFSLDRLAVSDRYELQANVLADWQPIYDGFKPYPLSYSITANGDLIRVAKDGGADSTALREHLEYVMTPKPMKVIDVGMGERGVSLFPEPLSKSQPDPLAPYLHGLADWLLERGWLDKATLCEVAPPRRYQWAAMRAEMERVQRADARIRRLTRGPLHPYWERYTDIWAAPLTGIEPNAAQRLRGGQSLTVPIAFPAEVSASTSGATLGGWETTARDAYDGSPYTAWCSAGVPTKNSHEWLRIDFSDTVKLSSLSVIWQPGQEANDLRLETSFDGSSFSSATTRWQGHDASGPKFPAWTEGTLAMTKPARALRVSFLATVSNGPVGVREVLVGTPSDSDAMTQIETPELWLALTPTEFPCLALDAAAGESRLIPWIAWSKGLTGVLGGRLNRWPRTWNAALLESASDWEGVEDWSEILAYPGPTAPLPSIRLQLLRDGIEDYEYLVAAEKAVREGRISDTLLRDLRLRKEFSASPAAAKINAWAKDAMKARVQLGRALTQAAKEGK